MSFNSTNHTICGFTLIELLVTSLLLSLLYIMGSSAFVAGYRSSTTQNLVHQLSLHLRHARNQAIIMRTTTTVCHSMSGKYCDGDWTNGILGFSDHNKNYQQDEHDKKLFYYKMKESSGLLTWKSFMSADSIQFNPDGRCYTHNGTLTYKSPYKDQPIYKIIINRQGRIRVKAI